MPWKALIADLETELREPLTLDGLTGAWHIVQRAGGHRHSVDDVLTAHYALSALGGAPATHVLDLGSGIGGVGLLVLWGLGPEARLTCIEAQQVSYRLLVANVAGNRLTDRVVTRLGDLRDLRLDEQFPLITGSPPYFPVGTGVLPADSQKAHARFELRGDVGDYAQAAARHLTRDGLFVFCFPSPQRARAEARVRDAGLHVIALREVVPRVGLRPLFTLFACRRDDAPGRVEVPTPATLVDSTGVVAPRLGEPTGGAGAIPNPRLATLVEPTGPTGGAGTVPTRRPDTLVEPPFEVRTQDGEVTQEMTAVRRRFGFP